MALVVGTGSIEDQLACRPEMAQQATDAFNVELLSVFRRTDRLFAALILFEWTIIAASYRETAWTQISGFARLGLAQTFAAILLIFVALGPLILAAIVPGKTLNRHLLAINQVIVSSLCIYVSGGYDGTYLHLVAAVAFLVTYRDWKVITTGSIAAGLLCLITAWPGAFTHHPFDVQRLCHGFNELAGLLFEGILLMHYSGQSMRELQSGIERTVFVTNADQFIDRTIAKHQWSEDALRAANDHLHEVQLALDARVKERTTELAEANMALLRNNSVLKAQQETTLDGILIVNENREITTVNGQFCDLWQIPEEAAMVDTEQILLDYVLPSVKNPDAFLEVVQYCNDYRDIQWRDEVELCDGRILDRYSRPAFSADGEYFGRVWYFRDITDRRRAEGQILVLNRELSRAYESISTAYDATIEGWSHAMDLRDKETEGHSQRVSDLTLRMAIAMGMCGDEIVQARRGALLHDIGKMGVRDDILHKPGPLTDDEWVEMRRHPQYAYDMLSPIGFLRPALEIPYCHHEKWDGTGYPRGLKGEEIPLPARLFAIVDVYDALRSDRPYRCGWSQAKVLGHIENLAGSHFDPYLVPVFLSVIGEDAGENNSPIDHTDYELFGSSDAAVSTRRAA